MMYMSVPASPSLNTVVPAGNSINGSLALLIEARPRAASRWSADYAERCARPATERPFTQRRARRAYSSRMRGRSSLIVAAFWLPLIAAGAQRSVLPAWVCSEPDAVFVAGFETGEAPVPHQASGGSGGLYAGDISRQVSVAGLGTQTYYLHIPLHYKPNHPWPLVVALHGAGGPNTSDVYARTVRSDWGGVGEAGGFLVIAPVGTDSTGGGWIEPGAGGEGPSDYDIVAAAIADTEAAYNVDLDRVYLWGYSAG